VTGVTLEERGDPSDFQGQIRASRPLVSIRLISFLDGPAGFFAPRSHCLTVDVLTFITLAKAG
jgi:hypothetical protein